jgi:hypothetical protein
MPQATTPDSKTKVPDNGNNPDNIIEDEKSLAIKDKVMARLKANTWLNSISKMAMYVGTLLTTATTGVVLGSLLHGGALAAALTAPVIGALAIGAAVIGVAVVTDFMASRIWQGANFDNLEANADSTARHLVKELKVNNMCLTNEQDSPCAAHKQQDWAARVGAAKQQQADWAARIDMQSAQVVTERT